METTDNLRIKVCGMREPGNVREVARLPLDYMGFIFYDRSPRFCGGISPDVLAGVAEMGVVPVAVTVDMAADELSRLADIYGVGTLQLHGSETPEVCSVLRSRGFTVWKAMALRSHSDMEKLAGYAGTVDMFLFDTPAENHGGSGRKFDWNLLGAYPLATGFMLSGGISPSDAMLIKRLRFPGLMGVDLNSRFEISPGVKDVALLSEFMAEMKE